MRIRVRHLWIATAIGAVLATGAWATAELPRGQSSGINSSSEDGAATALIAAEIGVLEERMPLTAVVASRPGLEIQWTASEVAEPVVTAQSQVDGSTASNGAVLLEVSGRPVILGLGPVPMYRNLGPGDEGRDVEQLQLMLIDAGLLGSADGVFGPSTERALDDYYGTIGYESPTRPRSRPAAEDASVTSPEVTQPTGTALHTEAVYVPRSELVFVPELPSTVSAPLPVGERVQGPLAVLTADSPRYFAAPLLPTQAAVLTTGMEAEVLVGSTALRAEIQAVRNDEQDDPVAVISSDDLEEVAGVAVGDQVRVEVIVRRVETTPSTVIVPVAAVVTDYSAASTVTVRTAGREFSVPVQVQDVVGGEAIVSGDVGPGDMVVVRVQEQ